MKFVIVTLLLLLAFALGFAARERFFSQAPAKVNTLVKQIERPLEKYTVDNLSVARVGKTNLALTEILEDEEKYTSSLFVLEFDPTLTGMATKKVTGQINFPKEGNKLPLILMLRGFVNQEIYETGVGTRGTAAFFSENGFITLAPDFLGYAGSDRESTNIFETRFQTYTTVLALLNSLYQIEGWDGRNVFLWAHSNGGQVALTTLTITGRNYPTTLWAPVTKPFPYSILFYTDDSVDKGKFLRRELALFEEVYDVEKYSFDNYLQKITAPIQIHQGTGDDAVPVSWSNSFVTKLEKEEKEIDYYLYPGADHNLRPNWEKVVERDLEFFRKHLKT